MIKDGYHCLNCYLIIHKVNMKSLSFIYFARDQVKFTHQYILRTMVTPPDHFPLAQDRSAIMCINSDKCLVQSTHCTN